MVKYIVCFVPWGNLNSEENPGLLELRLTMLGISVSSDFVRVWKVLMDATATTANEDVYGEKFRVVFFLSFNIGNYLEYREVLPTGELANDSNCHVFETLAYSNINSIFERAITWFLHVHFTY